MTTGQPILKNGIVLVRIDDSPGADRISHCWLTHGTNRGQSGAPGRSERALYNSTSSRMQHGQLVNLLPPWWYSESHRRRHVDRSHGDVRSAGGALPADVEARLASCSAEMDQEHLTFRFSRLTATLNIGA